MNQPPDEAASELDNVVEPHAGADRKSKKKKTSATVKRTVGLTAAESLRLDQIKQACAEAGIAASKNQLIRAAIGLLAALPPASLARQWQALAPVKGKKPKK